MSLHSMSDETIRTLPDDHLENAANALIISSFQAADWEPSGKRHGHQFMRHRSGREVAFVVVPMGAADA